MASISSNCCMSMKPPPPSSSSSSSSIPRSTHVSWPRKKEIGSWRRNMVLGMACMIITLQNGEINLAEGSINVENAEYVVVESKKGSQQMQWSNQRQCEAWRLNSLETIVPENLPRPSGHRRWEKVNNESKQSGAPAVKMMHIGNKCYTM